jgi:hypothetical protein
MVTEKHSKEVIQLIQKEKVDVVVKRTKQLKSIYAKLLKKVKITK